MAAARVRSTGRAAQSTSVESSRQGRRQAKEEDKQQTGHEDEQDVELEEKQDGEQEGKKESKQEGWKWRKVVKRVAKGALIGAAIGMGVALLTSPPAISAMGLTGTGTVVKSYAAKAAASASLAVMKDILQPFAENVLRGG